MILMAMMMMIIIIIIIIIIMIYYLSTIILQYSSTIFIYNNIAFNVLFIYNIIVDKTSKEANDIDI